MHKEEDNPILKNLNPAQREAVVAVEGPILIIAGAGSGKTRVLTHKIAYLIDIGIPPQNILALTFTNKAAQVMKERIASLVNPEASKRIWAGTFHSIFARILRLEAHYLGYTSNFSIYDTEDSLNIIKRILQNYNVSNNKLNPDSVHHIISISKNKVLSPQDFIRNASNQTEKIIGEIYKEYQDYLQQNNAMDFDDLLVNTFELFSQFPEILEKYQNRFNFILVDEYQDTNRVQYLVLRQLSSKYRNITVVGDDAQSIYRWRGADIRNILDFQKDFPDVKIFRLEQNYRSTKCILAAADSVIKFNKKQIEKKLWTENPEGELIELYQCETEKDEANLVVKKIKELISGGEYSLGDIAIFYRTNAQSLEFENALRRENINYVVVGGLSFYKRKEVKDVLAYLRLLINPDDNEAFVRIINEPPRGIGKTTLTHLLNYSRENRISLFKSLEHLENIPNLQKRSITILEEFRNWIITTQEKLNEGIGTAEIINEYIKNSGLISMYEEIATDDAFDRLENIETLLSDIYEFLTQNENMTLNDYLQQISLISDIDEKNLSTEQVKMMTLHSAKGLEFPVVFIVGLEQGLFPLNRFRPKDLDDEEEERRLFYVGLTRAMKKVFLTYAKIRHRFGDELYQVPSKFISEIDRSLLLTFESENKTFRRPTTYSKETFVNSNNFNEFDQTEDGVLRIGDRVVHPFFGIGKVEHLEGSGNFAQALVNFESVGRKRLMLQYAKLKKL
ncbi:MAG: ATP-dependent DNA helicase UvrD/PcrA [Candidatus Kapaibacterium sp.]|nr:MAG: ATP-dependent DNA helicase UvrD/PcrA [Candidatus Kapabacteria bacterium]